MEHIDSTLADTITKTAIEQFKTAYKFKEKRMQQIAKNEEFYLGRDIKVPEGRFGVPFPTMSGFVDTLLSKIDDPPTIKYGWTDIADLKLAQKVSAASEKDAAITKGNWPLKDRWEKKLAIFSGRGIKKFYAESDPKYKSYLSVVDHNNFVCEPKGGGDLEDHLYLGQQNVFRTKAALLEGAKSGIYNSAQVRKLLHAVNDGEHKLNEDLWSDQGQRYARLGLDLDEGTYVGQEVFRLIEWGINYNGVRYYMLFDFRTGIWIRAHKLTSVFESGLWPWLSWATNEDAFNFWSKAPCDDVRPVADAIDVLLNQALENRDKRNMGMRAYDSNIFEDPSELEYSPDGLVEGTISQNQKLADGIYEFKTPEVGGTVDLAAYLREYIGRESGIGKDAQGAAETDDKVGIVFSNIQQMADRLGLHNKSYRENWAHLGIRAAWGFKEHLSEPELIEMIGEDGIGWAEQKSKSPLLDIDITGGSAEIAANEVKSQKRENALMMIAKDPFLAKIINATWRAIETLKHGGYEESEIKQATSRDDAGDMELQSEAAQAIQDILAGETPELNRGANTLFMQIILDYAMEKEVTEEQFQALMKYGNAHTQIAIGNMIRKANQLKIGMATSQEEGAKPPAQAAEPPEGAVPPEESPAADVGVPVQGPAIGQNASNRLQGKGAPVA